MGANEANQAITPGQLHITQLRCYFLGKYLTIDVGLGHFSLGDGFDGDGYFVFLIEPKEHLPEGTLAQLVLLAQHECSRLYPLEPEFVFTIVVMLLLSHVFTSVM